MTDNSSRDHQANTRITDEEDADLDAVVELRGSNRATIVREAIQLYLYGEAHFGVAWPLSMRPVLEHVRAQRAAAGDDES